MSVRVSVTSSLPIRWVSLRIAPTLVSWSRLTKLKQLLSYSTKSQRHLRIRRSVYWTCARVLVPYGLITGTSTDLVFSIGVSLGFMDLRSRVWFNSSFPSWQNNVRLEFSVPGPWCRDFLGLFSTEKRKRKEGVSIREGYFGRCSGDEPLCIKL